MYLLIKTGMYRRKLTTILSQEPLSPQVKKLNNFTSKGNVKQMRRWSNLLKASYKDIHETFRDKINLQSPPIWAVNRYDNRSEEKKIAISHVEAEITVNDEQKVIEEANLAITPAIMERKDIDLYALLTDVLEIFAKFKTVNDKVYPLDKFLNDVYSYDLSPYELSKVELLIEEFKKDPSLELIYIDGLHIEDIRILQYNVKHENNLRKQKYIHKVGLVSYEFRHPTRFKSIIANAFRLDTGLFTTINFEDLSIDQDDLQKIFIKFTANAFLTYKFNLNDIEWKTNPGQTINIESLNNLDTITGKLNYLFSIGVGFIPSIVFISLDTEKQAEIVWEPRDKSLNKLTLEECSKLLFLSWFFIFTQARWPNDKIVGGQVIRNLVSEIRSDDSRFELFFSCNSSKLPKEWIDDLELKNIPQELLNRFALGIAGYRLPAAFAYIDLLPSAPDRVRNLQTECKKILQALPDKNMHPVFRSNTIITKYGSINKSLTALLAKYGDPIALQAMVDRRALYTLPINQPIDEKIFDLTVEDFNKRKFNFMITPE